MSAAKSKDAGKESKAKDAGKEPKGQPKEPRAPKEARQQAPREGRKGEQSEAKEAAAPKEKRPERPAPVPRLQVLYRESVMKQMMEQFGYKTTMEVPRIQKIVLNMGVGEAVADKKIMDNAVSDMTKIAGQRPLVTNARKAIAN